MTSSWLSAPLVLAPVETRLRVVFAARRLPSVRTVVKRIEPVVVKLAAVLPRIRLRIRRPGTRRLRVRTVRRAVRTRAGPERPRVAERAR